MGNTGGPEHDAEGTELRLMPAVALAVLTVEKQGNKREFVRVHRELARRRVTHIGENGAALLAFAVDGAEEVACPHMLSCTGAGNFFGAIHGKREQCGAIFT